MSFSILHKKTIPRIVFCLFPLGPVFAPCEAVGSTTVQAIKKQRTKTFSVFLSMSYKKDIFGSFAYDFELLRK